MLSTAFSCYNNFMKILNLADIHYDLNNDHLHYPASREMVTKLFTWLNKHAKEYDLITVSGDITVKGTTTKDELSYVKEKFDQLDTPYIIIPGNHDLCPLKKMEERYPGLEEYEYTSLENTNFYKVFGEDGVRYSKVINNIHFIGFAIRNDDPDKILDWLQQQLLSPYEKIVFGHFPIIPTREAGFCSTWDYFRIENSIKPLNDLIFNRDYKVKAYFCGHQHINSIIKVNNSYHIETAASVLGSCSYRVIDIVEKNIIISTHFFNDINNWVGDLLLIDKSVDSTHQDPYEYQRGNQQDLYIQIERESP